MHENLGGTHALANQENQFDIDNDIPDLSGKVALVTGASEGIGYGQIYYLLKNNISKIFCISMSEQIWTDAKKVRASSTLPTSCVLAPHTSIASQDLAGRLGQDKVDKLIWFQGDLADYKLATEIAKKVTDQAGGRLDIVILTAAYAIMPYELRDGVDLNMAVNHFGHTTLVSHLLPLIKQTAQKTDDKVRIVTFASNAHEMAPKDTKFASLEEINVDSGPSGNYGLSKLAQLLYARYLNTHLTSKHPNILVNSVHPGVVATKASESKIEEAYPGVGKGMSVLMQPFKKDQFEGATSSLFCATKIQKSGAYICSPAIEEPGSKLSQDMDLAENLMQL